MALLGPMVVVAETSAADLLEILGTAGAFPVVETPWADAPAALAEIQPVAVAIADPHGKPPARHVRSLGQCIEQRAGPIMPVIALVHQLVQNLVGAGYTECDFAVMLTEQARASAHELVAENIEVDDGLSAKS